MDYKEYERTFPRNFLRHLCSHNLLLKFDSKSTKISSKILKCNPNITKVRSEKYKSAVLTVYLKAPPNEQPLFGKREILLVKHQCLSVWPPQKHVLDQQRLLVENKQLFLNTDKQNLSSSVCRGNQTPYQKVQAYLTRKLSNVCQTLLTRASSSGYTCDFLYLCWQLYIF